jgi:ribosomal protein S18 acetylase RimI-like enzyme/predicted N-acetyltransferase YhbS
MLTYRTFCNTDPPVITALWRSRAGQPGLRHSVSPDLFEQLVFAKLYFDYHGLVIAWDDGRPVGFAHAAFGPNETSDGISTEQGVTCLVLVRPDCAEAEVASGLLRQCERYLRQRGAKVFYGGGVVPLCPFYLGLYGGAELPGVLEADTIARQLYTSCHYEEVDQTVILQRELGNFEAPIDRRQMEIRRRMIVEVTADPPSRTWWEACTLGEFELTRLELVPRGGGPVAAQATFRGMEPTGASGVGRAAGLVQLHVGEAFRRRGLAVFVLSEACRQLVREGVMLVEAQTLHHNLPALGLLQKLGFTQVAQGSVFRKEAAGGNDE